MSKFFWMNDTIDFSFTFCLFIWIMSTTTVTSYTFQKSLYDSVRKSDFNFFRKNQISDDNIFGREKLNYVYDVPNKLLVNKKRSNYQNYFWNYSALNNKISVSFEKPTNFRRNGVHLCQEQHQIKRCRNA